MTKRPQLSATHFLDMEHKTDWYDQPLLHWHTWYEIFLSRIDGIVFFVDNNRYVLNKNDFIILHKNDLHRSVAPKDQVYDRYIVSFDPRYVDNLNVGQENLLACFEKRSPLFQHKIHLTEEEAQAFISITEQPHYPMFPHIWQKTALSQVLMFVNQKYKDMLSDDEYHKEKDILQKIDPAIQCINDNLAETLLLEDLASLCYMEKTYFCKVFKRATGFAPHEYICYKRVITAKTLLLQGIAVIDVSAMVGYKSSTHFSTKFKKYWGVTPQSIKTKS